MGFAFDIDKAIQVTACLLRPAPAHAMNYLKLLKLLYIVDRESLRLAGFPVTGDVPVAMPQGPAPSHLCDLVRRGAQAAGDAGWSRHFTRDGYTLRLVTDPGRDRLSDYEVEVITKVYLAHTHHDQFALRDLTHTFPEWQRNQPGGSSRRIPWSHILQALGKPPQDVAQVEREASEDAYFTRLFGAQ